MPSSPSQKKGTALYRAFFITVIINGCIALGDFFAGLFFVFERQIDAMVSTYHYPFAATMTAVANRIAAQSQGMGMMYFFSHSIVKLFLTWGLLTGRLWAYPLSIIFLTGFGIYQIYTLFGIFSLFTLFLLIINAITVFFIAQEYRSL